MLHKTTLVGVLVFLLGAVHAVAQTSFPYVELKSSKLKESSGICSSPSSSFLWSHNDSGDDPRIFSFQPSGRLHRILKVKNAKAVDWEDICAFESDGKSYLAIGDIGDNLSKRKNLEVYITKQPQEKNKSLKAKSCIKVRFPDGPVNCEGLAYDPVTKQLVLFTKEFLQCRLFGFDVRDWAEDQSVTAEFITSFQLPLVTGADISRDGKHLVLVTYGPGLLVRRVAGKWQEHGEAQLIQLPPRKQGEAVCFSAAGDELFLTSEQLPAPLYKVSLSGLQADD